jgi:TatD DNase family protein
MRGIGNNVKLNQMIDTHCHLYEESFIPSLDEVLHRAKEAGVTQILLPNIDVDSWEPLLKVLNNPIIPCSPMLGLHPCYVKEEVNDQLNTLGELLKTHHEQLVAIGEIGMDLYWDNQFLTQQQQALNQQIEWALQYNLPIAIHVRDAFDPLFDVLSDYQHTSLRGVFHCFTGTKEQAEYILRTHPSFYFGIGGVLTYKNSGLAEVVKTLPLDRIVLETDAPYLPPTPHRGKRNEPSYLIHIADALSNVLAIPVTEVNKITSENARRLFNLNVQHL